MSHWFAYPLALSLFGLLPMLGSFVLWSWLRRRQALARFGTMTTLETVLTVRRFPPFLRGTVGFLGVLCLLAGLAGPQWGRDWKQAAAPGRDLIVVVDCSRSMFAESPSRFERARAFAADLSEAVQKPRRPSPRPRRLRRPRQARLPLDPRLRILPRSAAQPRPGDVRPRTCPRSARRLRHAHRHRPVAGRPLSRRAFPRGARHPAAVRRRRSGARRRMEAGRGRGEGPGHSGARRRRRRPEQGEYYSRRQGRAARRRRQRSPQRLEGGALREIAQTTQGAYVPAQTQRVAAGPVYLDAIAALPVRESDEDALPAYHQRYAWFYVPALALFALAMAIPDRLPRLRQHLQNLFARLHRAADTTGSKAAVAAAAVTRSDAAGGSQGRRSANARPGRRRGGGQQQLRSSGGGSTSRPRALYPGTGRSGLPPGRRLVSDGDRRRRQGCSCAGHKKRSCWLFRCCVDDKEYRAAALFGLGNCPARPLAAAQDLELARAAVAAYEQSLQVPGLADKLADDARYNLEQALTADPATARPPPASRMTTTPRAIRPIRRTHPIHPTRPPTHFNDPNALKAPTPAAVRANRTHTATPAKLNPIPASAPSRRTSRRRHAPAI